MGLTLNDVIEVSGPAAGNGVLFDNFAPYGLTVDPASFENAVVILVARASGTVRNEDVADTAARASATIIRPLARSRPVRAAFPALHAIAGEVHMPVGRLAKREGPALRKMLIELGDGRNTLADGHWTGRIGQAQGDLARPFGLRRLC